MKQRDGQSFFKGAAILSVSAIIVKVLGILFTLPIANMVDSESMNYFYNAYDIFVVFTVVATGGLPIAVSRMVSGAYALGKREEGAKIFNVAKWLFIIIGGVSSILMFALATPLSHLMSTTDAGKYAIMALAPTVFFCTIMSALRGYFQGRSNMTPTAVSQVIEAVTKIIFGVSLTAYVMNVYARGELGAAAAILGVTISAGLGAAYLVYCKIRQNKWDRYKGSEDAHGEVSTGRQILKGLVAFAVPIALGAVFLYILDIVDGAIVIRRLQYSAGFSSKAANSMRAMLGHARKLFDLPGALVVPMATTLLPILTGAIEKNERAQIVRVSKISIRVALLIATPCALGLILFAKPLCAILYYSPDAGGEGAATLLSLMSIAVIFNSILFITNSMLQSFKKVNIPVINMAIGGVVRIFLNWLLTGIPQINIMGSSVATVVSYLLIMTLNLMAVYRTIPELPPFFKMFLPSLLASLVMGAVSYIVYFALVQFMSLKIAVVFAIIVAVAVYTVFALKFKAATKQDILSLPKGEKIAALLHM